MSKIPHPSEPSQKHDAYAALRIRDFRFFIASRFFMTICFQMIAVIVGWQVYDITNNPLDLGFIGLVEAFPNILVALYAGYIADRYNRKSIALLFLILAIVSTSFLWYYSTIDTGRTHEIFGIFPLYAIIFIIGLARGFITPAISALLMQIVPRQKYANSSAWSSNIWQVAAILGPAMGGLIYGYSGLSSAYAVAAISLIVAIVFFSFIVSRPLPPITKREPIRESIRTGLKFVFNQPIILGTITLDLFAVLFGGAVILLPVFSKNILMVGSEGLGLLRAAPAVGAVIMAFILAHQPPMKKAGRNLFIAVAGFGVCMIAFALSRNFILSLFLLMLSGMLDNVSVVIRSTVIQLLTPDSMRGRVSAVNSIFIGSSNEIGAFESGVAAKILGTITSVVFGGSVTLVVVALMAKFNHSIRTLNLKQLSEGNGE